jgi:GAF domain-containing protein
MPHPRHQAAVEIYRTALARITRSMGASFASIFLRDEDDPALLRLACAQNWPQSSARFLGDLRFREGRGPTGRAVSTGLPIQVADVFDDAALSDWWLPAREMGFVSMISVPLAAYGQVLGAASFYFVERQDFDRGEGDMLARVARELSQAAERAAGAVSPSRSEPGPESR